MYKLNLGFFDQCARQTNTDGYIVDSIKPHSAVLCCKNSEGDIDIVISPDGDSACVPMFEISVSTEGSIKDKNVRANMLAEISMKIVCMLSKMIERCNLPVDLNDIIISVKQTKLHDHEDNVAYGWVDVGIAYLTSERELERVR
jgi:hypothetical protein